MSFWIQCFNVCINCTVAYYIGPTVVMLCNPDNTIIVGHRLAHRLANWVWAHHIFTQKIVLTSNQTTHRLQTVSSYIGIKTLQIQQSTIHIFAIISLFHFTLSTKFTRYQHEIFVKTLGRNHPTVWSDLYHERYSRMALSSCCYLNFDYPCRCHTWTLFPHVQIVPLLLQRRISVQVL
jgi:hypothetical protein